jgi:hypothetical protein
MKELLLVLIISTIFNVCSYSQTAFEKGYFINENGQKMECLIENVDWKNNPTEFKYRLEGNLETKKANISSVKEFGIHDVCKYIRAKVNIDRSSDDLGNIDFNKNPVFLEEQLFLKVLIEGEASLFFYEDGDLKRFFYQTKGSEIKQLIRKEYLTKQNLIAINNTFRQQLYNDLKCQDIAMRDLEDIKYTKNSLERVVVKYNVCANSQYVDFKPKKSKDLFNLTIRPGLNISSLSGDNSEISTMDIEFGTELKFRLGIEAEVILPFNNNKWALIAEPTYQSFKTSKRTQNRNVSGGILVSTVDYTSIELPLGVRHYFFLKNGSKIFINVAAVGDFSFNSSVQFARSNGSVFNSLDIKSRLNMALGAGYKLKKRYSLEIRYLTDRELLGNYAYWKSSYKTLSAIVGYSF